jgi:hypothetical protein
MALSDTLGDATHNIITQLIRDASITGEGDELSPIIDALFPMFEYIVQANTDIEISAEDVTAKAEDALVICFYAIADDESQEINQFMATICRVNEKLLRAVEGLHKKLNEPNKFLESLAKHENLILNANLSNVLNQLRSL